MPNHLKIVGYLLKIPLPPRTAAPLSHPSEPLVLRATLLKSTCPSISTSSFAQDAVIDNLPGLVGTVQVIGFEEARRDPAADPIGTFAAPELLAVLDGSSQPQTVTAQSLA